ncbi:MAG: DUF2974 domain-containing protein [Lachnospiraceae bacterium]|nr:DUF2974 domain-containing protein [Lachnospiraceae bacterium]
MTNFMDYLDWRGDLTFEEAPFNEVDALLLSYLSYVNFDKVLPDWKRADAAPAISLRKAREAFFTMHKLEDFRKDRSFIRQAPSLLEKIGKTRRFGDIALSCYVDHVDLHEEEQFAALCMDLGKGRHRETPEEGAKEMRFVSFRGTDDTIIGWKEDFNLSYLTVPAEQEAVDYLNAVLKNTKERVLIGGHSKGAHLSVYAAAKADPDVRKKIGYVYNFDGPGFDREFLSSRGIAEIHDRIRRYVPEDSVIGMLLDHNIEPVIVKSSEKGLMQHDPFSWQLSGPAFLSCPGLGKMGQLMDKTFSTWIAQVEPAQRKVFIDDLFSVLEASGARTLTELYSGNPKSYLAMVKRLDKLDESTGKTLKLLVESMFEQMTEQLAPARKESRSRRPRKAEA